MTPAAVSPFPAAQTGPRVVSIPLEALLVSETCQFFGVDPDWLRSSRRGYYSSVRRALTYVLVTYVGWTERRTAKFLKKHHSVVQDALTDAGALLRTDPIFFEIVERLRLIVSPYDSPV
jgi:hypothetical protein